MRSRVMGQPRRPPRGDPMRLSTQRGGTPSAARVPWAAVVPSRQRRSVTHRKNHLQVTPNQLTVRLPAGWETCVYKGRASVLILKHRPSLGLCQTEWKKLLLTTQSRPLPTKAGSQVAYTDFIQTGGPRRSTRHRQHDCVDRRGALQPCQTADRAGITAPG